MLVLAHFWSALAVSLLHFPALGLFHHHRRGAVLGVFPYWMLQFVDLSKRI